MDIYQVIRDNGDRYRIENFKTLEEAQKYIEDNFGFCENYILGGNTDDSWFWHNELA